MPRRKTSGIEPSLGNAGLNLPQKVLHHELRVVKCVGAKALTAAVAKEILGWEEVEAKDPSCYPELARLFQANVRLLKCHRQRPIQLSWVRTLCQEILNRKWRLTGYTIQIGKTDIVMDGQHRLLALVLAAYVWAREASLHWRGLWPTEPVLETAVAYGIDEDDDTFQAMNCVLRASPADTIYRSLVFAGKSSRDRKVLSLIAEYAIRLLWERTWIKREAYTPYWTPAEAMDLLGRHPRIKDCCLHIWEENLEGKIGKYLPPGAAAGMLYLMGCSASDLDTYRHANPRREEVLDWSRWNAACNYWTYLVGHDTLLSPIRKAIEAAANADGEPASRDERLAILTKGWLSYAATGRVDALVREDGGTILPDLAYRVDRNDDGTIASRELIDRPLVGGIDQGKPNDGDFAEEGDSAELAPALIEVEERKVAIRQEKAQEVLRRRGLSVANLAGRLAALRELHPGKLLLVKGVASYTAYGEDAAKVAMKCNVKIRKYPDGIQRASMSLDQFSASLAKLVEAGYQVVMCEP